MNITTFLLRINITTWLRSLHTTISICEHNKDMVFKGILLKKALWTNPEIWNAQNQNVIYKIGKLIFILTLYSLRVKPYSVKSNKLISEVVSIIFSTKNSFFFFFKLKKNHEVLKRNKLYPIISKLTN